MSLINDLAEAVKTYPEGNVTIEIVDVELVGDALNISETAGFKIKVKNNGALNLTNVTLRVKGLNGTTLKKPIGVDQPVSARSMLTVEPSPLYVTELITSPLPLIEGDGGSRKTENFTLRAPSAHTNGSARNLVKATLEGWDTNLDRILIDYTDTLDTVKGVYSAVVENA